MENNIVDRVKFLIGKDNKVVLHKQIGKKHWYIQKDGDNEDLRMTKSIDKAKNFKWVIGKNNWKNWVNKRFSKGWKYKNISK